MARTLSSRMRTALAAQATDEAVIVLVTIGSGSTAQRLSSDGVDTVSRGSTYVAYPFDVVLPKDGDEGAATATLSVDNVDRVLVEFARTVAAGTRVLIEIVVAASKDTVEASWDFEWGGCSYDAASISATLRYEPVLDEPYPGDAMDPTGFPGLFRS